MPGTTHLRFASVLPPQGLPTAFTQENPAAVFHTFPMLGKDPAPHIAAPMSKARQFELPKQFIKQLEKQNISARKNIAQTTASLTGGSWEM